MADATPVYEGWVDSDGAPKTATEGFTNVQTAKADITAPMPSLADATHTGTNLQTADADTTRTQNRSDNKLLTMINESVVPMLQRKGYTDIKALTDPNKIVDLGKAIGSLSASDIKDITGNFILQSIKTTFNDMSVELYKSPFLVDALKYGELTQSVYKTNHATAEESAMWHLQDGATYDLETYHGFTLDNRVFGKDISFRLVYSIPVALYDYAFDSQEKANALYSYIKACVVADMNEKANGVLLTLYQSIIYGCDNRGKTFKLVDKFNEDVLGITTSANKKTWSDITASETLMRQFQAYVPQVINNIRRAMAVRGTKYNDGSVLSVTQKANNVLCMNSQFADIMELNNYSMYHAKDLPTAHLVDFWQSMGESLSPTLKDVTSITISIDNVVKSIDNVVGIIADKQGTCVKIAPQRTTTSFNGNGNFSTFYDYFGCEMDDDPRANKVILVLE